MGPSILIRRKKRYVADISRLGAVCEANYLRVRKLMNLLEDGASGVALVLKNQQGYLGAVKLQVLENCKFTQTIMLEQTHTSGKWLNNPRITVRVYHDVSMAEVISCYRHQRIEAVNAYPNRFMHHPDEKVQINVFLADWLAFCLRFGCLDVGYIDKL